MPEILRFDPAPCRFPAPAVPMLPALRLQGLGALQADPLAHPGARFFARGRYALYAAYRLAGLGPGGALLAPSYHCRTMLDAALALGAAVQCYPLQPDLQPDLDGLRQLMAAMPAARALVLPHYFGIEQPAAVLAEVAALCAHHGVTLVEDASHAWPLAMRRGPLCAAGNNGHFLVASPYKFLPCEEGGVLWGPAQAIAGLRLRPASLLQELRGWKRAWARSRSVAAPPAPQAPGALGERGREWREVDERPSPHYHAADQERQGLRQSRWLLRRTAIAPMAARRRHHYQRWLQAVAPLAGARPLFPQLAADTVPYMFPLLLAEHDPGFYQLKQAGVPIWRWDDMASSACGTASAYRLRLLHLPCHQDLSAAQMDWLADTVQQVLA